MIYPRYQNSASSPPDRVLDDEGNLPPDLWLTDPSVADHYGPERASEAAQAAFWRPLDALAELARRE